VSLVLGVVFGGENWAVLVAGSNGYDNYRHQADVCHAYQVLTRVGGFPQDRVLTMMYDDVATSEENPLPGKLFNRPSGPDVYAGVHIDYRGDDVTPDNFLKVLRGDKQALSGVGSGRVLESGPDDTVFVFFADHGGSGFICFPNGYLYADQLNETLSGMVQAQKFNKLVFYLEACESGSMFAGILPHHEGVIAITASKSDQSSYATYYDEHLDTYLGDLFSVSWMEDSEVTLLNASYTLEDQYQRLLQLVTRSHPLELGESDLDTLAIRSFQSYKNNVVDTGRHYSPRVIHEPIDSRYVTLDLKQKAVARETDKKKRDLLRQELFLVLANKERSDYFISEIVGRATGQSSIDHPNNDIGPMDFQCLRLSMKEFETFCGRFDSYSLKHARSLSALCDIGISSEELALHIKSTCGSTVI